MGDSMDYLILAAATLLVATLTLFSGFGLGTLLLPAFALFYAVPTAVALTSVVHLANNVLKLVLLGKWADRAVMLRFGIPAILAALLGATLLEWLSDTKPLGAYSLAGRSFQIRLVNFVIALLIAGFVVLESSSRFQALTFDRKYLGVGGLLSGLFGGLSGHQGAFRSAFLLKTGLSKDQFIATGAVLAVLVDCSRLAVYATQFSTFHVQDHIPVLLVATVAAFLGTFLGSRLVSKVTMSAIRRLVAGLLILIAVGLGLGLV
jgi:hypothetical protein